MEVEYAIETHNLVKNYLKGTVKAVRGIDLKVRKGEIYAFIGANGSGKSTTIDIISGVLRPTSGRVKVLGLDIPKERRKLSQLIGVAPQEYSIYLDLSVWENISFFGRLYGMSKQEIEDEGSRLLKILKLEEKRDTTCEHLSGGMKRRVSIACALIHSPELILFDEATVGVDPILRAYFWDFFKSLRNEGKTILVTSHVMDEAEKADRIGLMREGRLIEEGTPSELLQRHQVKNVEELFIKLSGDGTNEN
ncbi:MAG: ABC transporter ATP-binding protein [Methanobacteriota archaeon]|nr:MAG: ABC transporter ATP-binding protein [Euryarchaeota archaeon]